MPYPIYQSSGFPHLRMRLQTFLSLIIQIQYERSFLIIKKVLKTRRKNLMQDHKILTTRRAADF